MGRAFDFGRASRNTKLLIILGCVSTAAVLGLEAWREHFAGEWRSYQASYLEMLPPAERGTAEVGLRQAFVPELGRVDRCQSCHAGIDNPLMAGQAQPLAAHPGHLLQPHPAEDFGCTVCHQGQGHATWLPDAHGEIAHWEWPLLRGSLTYTSCGRCHSENIPFGEASEHSGGRVADARIHTGDLTRNIPGADLLARGKELFVTSGCLGCHTYRGRGGLLGPDLTHVGDKDLHGFDYTNLPDGFPHTPLGWLEAHFLDPGAVSPGSVMPTIGLSRLDARSLAAYMLSFKAQDVPTRYRAAAPSGRGPEATGEQLYGLFCVACHGVDLTGGMVPAIRTPSLSNPDFLAVASDEYLQSMIERGRSGTSMPAWGQGHGGLTREQVQSLVGYIRSFARRRADIAAVSVRDGSVAAGRALYRGNCANCHGSRGEGGLGTALASSDFLQMASDDFLARTVVEGRPNTGMPSWRHLPSQQISDILAYIRSWQPVGPDAAAVVAYVREARSDARVGSKLFRARCADCHGTSGEGRIGPSLANPAFLGIVDDGYLVQAILGGRPGTAMPAWRGLSTEDVGDLVAFVRGLAPDVRYRAPQAPAVIGQGDPENGGLLFRRACASCHGEAASGGSGPQLANPAFLAQASDAFLWATISRGRAGTPMRGFLRGMGGERGAAGIADFTPSQIADIVAYLRSRRFQAIPPEAFRPVLGSAHRGRYVYEEIGACARCHGERGEGAIGTALGNPAFLGQATEGFLLGTLVLGRSGTEMRQFASAGLTKLTTEDLMDVTAYVRTLPATQPDGAQGWRTFLPAGGEDAGRVVFESTCAACHGKEGRGGYAPTLNNPEFLRAASDGFLVATIARGRETTPMRAFGPGTSGLSILTSDEIRAVVGYIRSWQRAWETQEPVMASVGTASAPSTTK